MKDFFQKKYYCAHDFFRTHTPRMYSIIWRRRRIGKYLASGGTAAFVNLAALYFFTDILGIWYLASSALAFVVAFAVSYTLQKFWTFSDPTKDENHRQKALYFIVALFNLGVNTLLMHFFVETFHLGYLVAQVIAGGLIASGSFFVYRHLIFKNARGIS